MTAKVKTKSKSKPRAPVTKPAKEVKMDARGHKQGSRKARVHELFDEEGAEVAFTLGKRVRLKEATLHSWFGAWRRQDKKATKPKTNSEAKPAEQTGPFSN